MNPKFCPFCGEGNSIVGCYQDDLGYWKVGCGACGSHSGTRPKSDPDGRAKVIANWNKAADAINRCSERTRDAEAKLAALSLCEPNFLDRKLRELDEAKAVVHEFYLWCSDLNDFRKDSRLARRARNVVNGAVSSPSTEGGNG